MTVDIEDNFSFEELKDKGDWGRYEKQVIFNTLKILDIFDNYKIVATFFVVGKVAERCPDLIREIYGRHHFISSHSYYHYPVAVNNESAFKRDLEKSLNLLSRIINKTVLGFRAMGYSIRKKNIEWVLQTLIEYNLKYDSSISPLNIRGFDTGPIYLKEYELYEFPLSVFNIKRMHLPFAGGTYLRFMPYKIIESCIKKLNKNGQPAVIYIHPWEFNKDQPARNISLKQKILQHSITFNTEKKLINLLNTFRFYSIENYLTEKKYL